MGNTILMGFFFFFNSFFIFFLLVKIMKENDYGIITYPYSYIGLREVSSA